MRLPGKFDEDQNYNENLQSVIKNIRNHKKIKDMSNVLNDFDEMCKVYEKAKKIIDKNTSRIFIKCLVELEDFVNENWEDTEGRKAMSKNNSKGLTALRQKLKKHNKEFEAELNEYRENPDSEVFDVEEKEADDLSSDDFSEMPKPAVNLKKEAPAYGDVDVKKKKEKEEKKVEVKEEKVGLSLVAVEKPELFTKDAEITVKTVLEKLFDLTAGLGKEGTDMLMQIELLVDLREIAMEKKLGDPVDCKIILSIIDAIFDYNQSVASNMKPEMWTKYLHYIKEVLAILLSSVDTIVFNNYRRENFDGTKPPYRIQGSMLTVVKRMDEEFTKMLQACDAHGTEYMERLRDEATVCQIIEDLEKYQIGCVCDEELCGRFLKRIQHIYRPDIDLGRASAKTVADRMEICDRLSRTYHHALHDRFHEARGLVNMNEIEQFDTPIKILFNMTMVQMGLCAFRKGLFKEAHDCLVDIQNSQEARELLAQGFILQGQLEQEETEERRQMPGHMHINLQLLECVYLVSAMFIEMPYMAARRRGIKCKKISEEICLLLDSSEGQTLIGPPESVKDHVMEACEAMREGLWKPCLASIINEKMDKVWDLFLKGSDIKNQLTLKIKEECFRCILFAYHGLTKTPTLEMFSKLFNLGRSRVHLIIHETLFSDILLANVYDVIDMFDHPEAQSADQKNSPKIVLELIKKLAKMIPSNYVMPITTALRNERNVRKYLQKLTMTTNISDDFDAGDGRRFETFDERTNPAASDRAAVEAGIEVEKIYWEALNVNGFIQSDCVDWHGYFFYLEIFGQVLMSKRNAAVSSKWKLIFEAWRIFADHRRKCGCAAIYDDQILLVQNQVGQWTLPKGKSELDELDHVTASREMHEETGVDHPVREADQKLVHYDKDVPTTIFIVRLTKQEKAMTNTRPNRREIIVQLDDFLNHENLSALASHLGPLIHDRVFGHGRSN